MANVHPWFANVSAENAAAWTADFFQTTDVNPANALSNKPQMWIAETGLPYYLNLSCNLTGRQFHQAGQRFVA